MFVHEKLHLKKLSGDIIPSGQKLFERYGKSTPKGHPDNTDPHHFTEPVNSHMSPLERLNSMQVRVRAGYATMQELAAREAAAAAGNKPEAETNSNAETTKETTSEKA